VVIFRELFFAGCVVQNVKTNYKYKKTTFYISGNVATLYVAADGRNM